MSFVKQVLAFGYRESASFFVRVAKSLKALHLWDETPVLTHRVPRAADDSRQHDASSYVDDYGLFAVKGFGQIAQDRFQCCISCRVLWAQDAEFREEDPDSTTPPYTLILIFIK